MSPNANEIGVNTHHTTNTELDKDNMEVAKQEEEIHYEYPNLRPARALLNLATGDLIEIMHRPSGATNTVEGLKTEKDEWFDETYRTKQGQDWGGIIQHHYIEFSRRNCPEPNAHNEIPAPTTRPDDSDRTDVSPDEFSSQELFDTEFAPYPLLLLERPEVSYDETIPGDTYDILGWYDPMQNNAENRVRPLTAITDTFPEITDASYTKTDQYCIPELNAGLPADTLENTSNIQITTENDNITLDGADTSNAHHIDIGTAFDEDRFLINSPYETKNTIKDFSGQPRWTPDSECWAVRKSIDTFTEIITALVEEAGAITITDDVLLEFAVPDIDVTIEEDINGVTTSDILEYAFVDEVPISSHLSLPDLPDIAHPQEIDSTYVKFDATGSVTGTSVEYSNSPSTATINQHGSGSILVDCSESEAQCVKSLDWDDARYEWNNSHGAWIINESATFELINEFLSNYYDIAVDVDILGKHGTEQEEIEKRTRDVDSSNIIAETISDDNPLVTPSSVASDTNTYDEQKTARAIHGFVPNNPSTLTLSALDIALGENITGHASIHTDDSQIPELRPSVKEQWQPALEVEDDVYEWYHPQSGARVTVEMQHGADAVESFGAVDYALKIKDPETYSPEHVVTVQDEQAATMAVISHLTALSR